MKVLNMASREMAWWDSAPCKGMDNRIFFPEVKQGHSSKGVYDQALAVCEGCMFRKQCLDFAIDAEMNDIRRYGVFGGLTPRDREEYFAGRLHPYK